MKYRCSNQRFNKTKSNFFAFHQSEMLDNLIRFFPFLLIAKSTMDKSLNVSLSCGSFVHNVEKSHVPMDLVRIFIYAAPWLKDDVRVL